MSFWGDGRSSKHCENYCEACLRIQTKLLGQIQKGQVMQCILLTFRFLVSQTNSESCEVTHDLSKMPGGSCRSDWLWVSWRATYHNSVRSSNWKANYFSLLFELPSIWISSSPKHKCLWSLIQIVKTGHLLSFIQSLEEVTLLALPTCYFVIASSKMCKRWWCDTLSFWRDSQPLLPQRSCAQAAQGEILGLPSEMVPLFQKELRTREGDKRKQIMRSSILTKSQWSNKNTLLFATYHTSENQIVLRS